jgi:hypothetical protein
MDVVARFIRQSMWDALVIASRHLPHMPHFFRPRRHGSKMACEVCGARREDDIHIDAPPRPPRRGKRASHG